MKIEIIAVSKDKDTWVTELSNEYIKRLSSTADVELIFVKEETVGDDTQKVKQKEGERILAKIKEGYVTIALDVLGKKYTSREFSQKVEQLKDFSGGKVQFIIGGPLGLSAEVLAHVHESISLSTMTLTHQMIRVLLLEQIYRAFEILKGSGYHK